MIEDQTIRLFDAGLGDCQLEQVKWAEDGDNLVVTLRRPGASAGSITLEFVWATAVSLLMEFGTYAGSPLLFEARLAPLTQDRWAVVLLFAGTPEGHLSCECNEVRVIDEGLGRQDSLVPDESPN